MDKHFPVPPEFSRLIAVDRLDQGEIAETIGATAEERAALAARFGLLSLNSLRAELTLGRVERGPLVQVKGRFTADVVQSCVISLEPVASRIEEDFTLLYGPERAAPSRGHVLAADLKDEVDDWPEPIEAGRIDVGEAVAQQLALALDPYPRKPGVRLEDVMGQRAGVSVEAASESPFAVLARISRRHS
jgi:hypothetical protein